MIHTWEIHDLVRNLSDGLVTTASYSCDTEYSSSYGFISSKTVGDLHLPSKSTSDEDFVDYNNLTENTVIGWVTGSIDKSSIESKNSSSIAERVIYEASKTSDNGTPW